MCPGRRAFGSCLVVAPGYVAHSHHNPGAAVPAAPVAGVVGVVGARGGCQLVRALLPSLFLCLGGIATIGVRHAGDTPSRGFYGRKIPRWALGRRCCAQRAVHLGRMRRKRGVWGEVDYVLSVGSRCWACAIGPRRRGRLRQCGRPGWRRGCEGWLPASSCPVAAFVLVVWGELRP